MPPAFRDLVAPMIPNIVQAIHEAFALAIASTFWVSIGAALIAAVLVLFLRQVPAVSRREVAVSHREPEPAA